MTTTGGKRPGRGAEGLIQWFLNRAAENLFISQPTLTYQIKAVEDEIGFPLFDRSGRGAMLTPAGAQFCTTLRNIRDELKRATEQGQNFSARYRADISVGLPMRSAIYFLPQAIEAFEKENEAVSVTPHSFRWPRPPRS